MTGLSQYMAFISMPGGGEWMVILIIGLLIFGRKLPEVARNLGKSVNEFKKGIREFQESADDVARDVSKVTSDVASDVKDAAGVNGYGYQEPSATGDYTSHYEPPTDTTATAPDGASEPAAAASDTIQSVEPTAVKETDTKQDEQVPASNS